MLPVAVLGSKFVGLLDSVQIITVRSSVRIEHSKCPAATQFFEREIAPTAHPKRLQNGLRFATEANGFAFSIRHLVLP